MTPPLAELTPTELLAWLGVPGAVITVLALVYSKVKATRRAERLADAAAARAQAAAEDEAEVKRRQQAIALALQEKEAELKRERMEMEAQQEREKATAEQRRQLLASARDDIAGAQAKADVLQEQLVKCREEKAAKAERIAILEAVVTELKAELADLRRVAGDLSAERRALPQ